MYVGVTSFCRLGKDVYGTPIIWVSPEKPLVYLFGFFAGVCVPIYSMCAGYARWLVKDSVYKENWKRIYKLMKNYWIILILFSCIGFITGGNIPGNWTKFLKSLVLLYSYNGAWWYLNTYVIILVIPTSIILFPVRKMEARHGISVCILIQMVWWFINRFSILPGQLDGYLGFIYKELLNLIGVIPYIWIGAFICKGHLLDEIEKILQNKGIKRHKKNLVLLLIGVILFIGYTSLNKSVLIGITGICTFFVFNLLNKPFWIENIFLCLGKHSTNIWLTHMFFYCVDPFAGLVQKGQYPLVMMLFILILTIGTSSFIKLIQRLIERGSQY